MGNCVIRITTLNPEQQKKKCDTLSVFASWEGESDKNREKGHSHKLLFFPLNQIHNTREMQSLKLIGGGGSYFPGYIQIFKEKKRPMQGNHEFKRRKRPLDLNLVPH